MISTLDHATALPGQRPHAGVLPLARQALPRALHLGFDTSPPSCRNGIACDALPDCSDGGTHTGLSHRRGLAQLGDFARGFDGLDGAQHGTAIKPMEQRQLLSHKCEISDGPEVQVQADACALQTFFGQQLAQAGKG
jgi:hypothetical protein